MTQSRYCLIDKKNRGGSSFVMRCESVVRDSNASCTFYAKLRRSDTDHLWYICQHLNAAHTCLTGSISFKLKNTAQLILAREQPEH
jgi:hypothetical protein